MQKYFIKNIGLIKASGKDFVDFVNRMSTNDFRKFGKDEFRKTIFTSDKGRIIDLVNILNFPDPIILTSQNFQNKIIDHLTKYIIMDDVNLEKADGEYCNIMIVGGGVLDLAREILNIEIKKGSSYKLNDSDYAFFDDYKFESLNIICKKSNIEIYTNKMKELEEMSYQEYEYFRIEAGLPEGENEFNEQINPMECGLEQYISFTKGCYIGQEVIARLDSQGKRPKQIVKIVSEKKIDKGEKIFLENKEAGFITSSINYDGGWAGLGFIRSVNLDFEKEYFAEDNRINIVKIN